MSTTTRPKANARDQVAYESGLLQAQQMANRASHAAHKAGQHDVANAMAALSSDLLTERLASEAWRLESQR